MKSLCRSTAAGPAMRFFSVLLAVCMIITAFAPGMTVHAADYALWVGGTQVTSSNASSLLGGKVSYNASTNTLTLNGASITNGVGIYDSDAKAAIYSEGDLNIILKGNNTISISGYAIAADGSLSITGGGTLTTTTSGDLFSSIFSGGSTKISGGTITLRATGSECIGLWAYDGLTVSGGTINVSATGAGSCGILCDSAITVSGGAVTANASGVEAWGIASFGKLSLISGSIKSSATSTGATGVYASSIELANGSFEVSGAESAVYLDNAGNINIGSGYSLYEGNASPGSSVSSFTSLSGNKTSFISKRYLRAADNHEAVRLGGGSRYETAINIASYGWTSADAVVLVNAFSFADALSGVPLAYALNAPILLVNGTSIDSTILRQISALGATKAYLLGGELAINAASAEQLKDSGLTVKRIYGTSRYDTAIAIARELSVVTGKSSTTAIFANGFNYPDALAASSAAAISGTPILYAPTSGKLDDNTLSFLRTSGFTKAYVLGGELAINADIYNSIKSNVSSVERISGGSRYETAVRIIEKFSSVFTGKAIAVATGTNYPDALAGAAFAAKEGIPVMLVPAALTSGSSQTTMLKGLITAQTSPVYIFGGQGAVSDAVVNELLK